ncbi:MAG: nicotinate (nicotinamide) nucleotide adenylyltransferase [Clostridia bacterium]|nr:nicotinate (nicotinamide) nucleotide adenylyltransferase [Clostridia bacterium]
MKKIGVFGGTFDPIHNGHLILADELGKRLALDLVILMPTFVPPHKIKPDLASAVDRVAMCRLACEPYERMTVSEWEVNRRGVSFTVLTLEALQGRYPDAQLYLFVGADMFLTLGTWYRFADIAKMAVLCTVPRDDVTMEQLQAYAAQLEEQGARCRVENIQTPRISSTDIRARAAAGESITQWVPPAVEQYIAQHEVYTAHKHYRNVYEQYIDIIRGRLTPKRFRHSLAVADKARELAQRYGADAEKAYTAGLLHDILKDTAGDSQLQILQDFDILLDDVEKNSPKLWHARAGAVFIEHILGIHDEDILNAVRYHTTGRAGMSLLEMILYLADFTSADRDYPDVDVLRELTDRDLLKAMEYAAAYTIEDLQASGLTVHPDTTACYDDILERLERE